jgi:hypothetical protein
MRLCHQPLRHLWGQLLPQGQDRLRQLFQGRSRGLHAVLQPIPPVVEAVVQPLPDLPAPWRVTKVLQRQDGWADHRPVLPCQEWSNTRALSLLTCAAGSSVLKNRECSQQTFVHSYRKGMDEESITSFTLAPDAGLASPAPLSAARQRR